ncbi:HmuY family protein [Mucilaginibacter sp. Mucisp84]|uniref:HmuY family protein n=1 Tax=Mucilaginibacter sp. Mucisp84 TaxID=3243058 RepID=UPI0039A46414
MSINKKTSYRLLFICLFSPVYQGVSQELTVKKVGNLNASDKVAYFNLEKGAQVNEADTAQTGWDISFQHTGIIVQNSAGGQVIANISFDKVAAAPAAGYKKGKQAIPWGSGNGWYTYNMDTHIINPITGRVILIHTAAGKYFKLVIDSYYKNGADGPGGYYSFHYAGIDPEK